MDSLQVAPFYARGRMCTNTHTSLESESRIKSPNEGLHHTWHGELVHSSASSMQLLPVNPAAVEQSHSYEKVSGVAPVLAHVPPLAHGNEQQKSTCSSQFFPV